MSDLKETVLGDIAIVEGNLVFVEGADEVAQRLAQRLSAFQGEWFLDLDSGLPYIGTILAKAPTSRPAEAILKREITETPGVLELLSFRFTVNSQRQATLDFSVRSEDGNVNLNLEI